MTSKLSPEQQAEKLIEHARTIGNEIYTLSIELTEDAREKAIQKINYGKHVLTSLENLVFKYLKEQNPSEGFLNTIYFNYISVKPHLQNAMDELQKRLDNKEYFVLPEMKDEPTELETNTIKDQFIKIGDMTPDQFSPFLRQFMKQYEGDQPQFKKMDNSESDTDEDESKIEEEEEEASSNEEETKNEKNVDGEETTLNEEKESNSEH